MFLQKIHFLIFNFMFYPNKIKTICMHLKNLFSKFNYSIDSSKPVAAANTIIMTADGKPITITTTTTTTATMMDAETGSTTGATDAQHHEQQQLSAIKTQDQEDKEHTQSTTLAKASIFTFMSAIRWWPTSEKELADVEESILSVISRPFKKYFVDIGPGWGEEENKINTLEMLTDSEIIATETETLPATETATASANTSTTNITTTSINEITNLKKKSDGEKHPLVMIHGFAAGLGIWILNLDELVSSLDRKIYAIDLLGFGRSSRPNFNLKEDVEEQFVDSIERWRREMKIEKFIIIGHSFGGYLSANYALRYPERVSHVVLADPWGVQDKQSVNNGRGHYRLPLHVRTVNSIFQKFNPLAVLRVTGPYGPKLVHTFRADLKEKFVPKLKDDSYKFLDYIYHCNAQTATGESAFKALSLPFGWAKNPLVRRLLDLDPAISLTFIYGSRSWIERSPGEYVRECLGPSRIGFYTIQGSGHHVYADKYSDFNDILKEVFAKLKD